MDENYLEKAREQAEKLKKDREDATKTLENLNSSAKTYKRELYELKKKYDDTLKTIELFEETLGIDQNTSAVIIESDRNDTTTKDVSNDVEIAETEKTKKSNETSKAVSHERPTNSTQKKKEKKIEEDKNGLFEEDPFDDGLDLDADDIFGDSLDVEIDNIEF